MGIPPESSWLLRTAAWKEPSSAWQSSLCPSYKARSETSASTDLLLYRTASFLGCAWIVSITGVLIFRAFQAGAGYSGGGGPEQYGM